MIISKNKTPLQHSNLSLQKKSVFIITSEFLPSPGGIGNHAFSLSKYLNRNNIDVTVIAPKIHKADYIHFDKKEKFKILRYSGSKFFKIFSIIKLFLIENVKSNHSVVICTGQIPFIIFGILNKLIQIKSILIFHGHEIHMGNFFIKYISNHVINNYDQVIAVSDFSGDLLRGKLDKNKIQIIYNGVDTRRFEKIHQKVKIRNIENLRLLTVGSLSRRKGQHNVIKALPEIKKYFRNVSYHMVGPDNIKIELTDLAKSLNIDDSIHFYGYLEDSELSTLFKECDIFLMLSENLPDGDVEGFGIAILEANYFGLPAIGSKGCGIDNAINNKRTGILIDSHNPIECRKAIQHIINDYQKFSLASKKWALAHDWSKTINKYIKII